MPRNLRATLGWHSSVSQSGERDRQRHITKEGNRMVRSLLLLRQRSLTFGAPRGLRTSIILECLSGAAKKIARVTAANKLLGIIFHMMKDQIDYQEFLVGSVTTSYACGHGNKQRGQMKVRQRLPLIPCLIRERVPETPSMGVGSLTLTGLI